jgi:hypothetical protein
MGMQTVQNAVESREEDPNRNRVPPPAAASAWENSNGKSVTAELVGPSWRTPKRSWEAKPAH